MELANTLFADTSFNEESKLKNTNIQFNNTILESIKSLQDNYEFGKLFNLIESYLTTSELKDNLNYDLIIYLLDYANLNSELQSNLKSQIANHPIKELNEID